jgi:hypothetical protein
MDASTKTQHLTLGAFRSAITGSNSPAALWPTRAISPSISSGSTTLSTKSDHDQSAWSFGGRASGTIAP